jgi:lipopolysaccharide transport system ATP-binding protein
MSTAISIKEVSKLYRLGEIGTGFIMHDVNRWWHKVRGKEDPYLKVGQSNDRSTKGDSDYVYAIKDVSFDVKQGEVLGVIGRNGAGKSTLLKILSRVTTPTSGHIGIKGRIASLLEVGTGFHPELTGEENIYLNGAILGMGKSEIRRKFDEIVDFSGCERYIGTPVKRYSSGMYVRLAFAVAAHLESEILILDEVLAVGDAEFQNKCLGKMKDVAGSGRTVIFVSHNMAAVKMLCANSVVLAEGKLVMSGPTHQCIDSYCGRLFNGANPISESVRIIDSGVKVNSIVINDSDVDVISLREYENSLNISIDLWLDGPRRLDMELCLSDSNGTVLAMFSIGHEQGITPLREAGSCQLNYRIQLPNRLNKGDYLLHLHLTHTNYEYFAKIENLRLIVEGSPLQSGKLLEYSAGQGWLNLVEVC